MNNPNLKSIHEAQAEMVAAINARIKQGFRIVWGKADDEACCLELEGRRPLKTIVARRAGSTIVEIKEFEGDASTNSWMPI